MWNALDQLTVAASSINAFNSRLHDFTGYNARKRNENRQEKKPGKKS